MQLNELRCVCNNINLNDYIKFRENIKKEMEDSSYLGDFSRQELEALLKNNSKIWMYYLKDEPVCSMMIIPATKKDLNKFNLNLKSQEVVDYGPMMVNPKFIGNGLQYQMLKELDLYCKKNNYKYAISTIHPDNKYSINNFVKDSFELVGSRKFKRGLRNIYIKKLNCRQVFVGKSAGFCYGVKRAVDGAEEKVKNIDNLYCLGEIVHNSQVVKDLENKGLKFINKIHETKGDTLIRAHGVEKDVYKYASNHNIRLYDFTCPKVLNIHNIVKKYNEDGFFILLIGSKKHPENIGTISYCKDNSFILENIDELEKFYKVFEKSHIKKLLIVSQTTYNIKKFEEIIEKIKSNLSEDVNLIIKNTICKATEARQKETMELSKKVDLMIIIGGKNSSNTKKLYEIASIYTKAICIETSDEIDINKLKIYNTIGIMAGASTPSKSIKEVLQKIKIES